MKRYVFAAFAAIFIVLAGALFRTAIEHGMYLTALIDLGLGAVNAYLLVVNLTRRRP